MAATLLLAVGATISADAHSPLTFACSDANLTEGFACPLCPCLHAARRCAAAGWLAVPGKPAACCRGAPVDCLPGAALLLWTPPD